MQRITLILIATRLTWFNNKYRFVLLFPESEVELVAFIQSTIFKLDFDRLYHNSLYSISTN